MMKTQMLASLTLVAIFCASPALAQTTLGTITLHEEDVPAAAAYCNALVAETNGGDQKTITEQAAADAPKSLTNDTGADGAASASLAASAPAADTEANAATTATTANAELDLSSITIEQCQESGLLDQ